MGVLSIKPKTLRANNDWVALFLLDRKELRRDLRGLRGDVLLLRLGLRHKLLSLKAQPHPLALIRLLVLVAFSEPGSDREPLDAHLSVLPLLGVEGDSLPHLEVGLGCK